MTNFPLDHQASTSSSGLPDRQVSKKVWYIGSTMVFICVLFGLLFFQEKSPPPEKKLVFVQCDVGQGDAIYMNMEGYEVLVDGGPDDRVLGCLKKFRPQHDDTLEVVVATHPDADHITGLVDVLKTYKIGMFLWNGDGKTTKIFRQLEETLKDKAISSQVIGSGDEIEIDLLRILAVWPDNADQNTLGSPTYPEEKKSPAIYSKGDVNARSIVLQVKFGDFNALLSGDLPEEEEEVLLSLDRVRPVVWFKVGHHGSAHSSGRAFLHALQPKICTIGVGKNTYGHPSQRVIESLQEVGCQIWRTDARGDIWGITDGRTYQLFAP